MDSHVLARIRRQGPGTVFTPTDFVDLGPRNAVDLALSRNARAGAIGKLARGIYHLPRRDARLGDLSPSPDDVASALAGRDGARLQASGAPLARAQRGMRVLVTFDKDFGELAFRAGAAAGAGVVLFRVAAESPDAAARIAVDVFSMRSDWAGVFAVVEDARIRIRELPGSTS